MENRERAVEAYKSALDEESRLWRELGGRLPGQAGFNMSVWQDWLHAVRQTNALSRQMRETFVDYSRRM